MKRVRYSITVEDVQQRQARPREPDTATVDAPAPEKRKYRTLAEREAAASARVPKSYVDFSHVAPAHYKVHDRLENWARACRGRDKQSGTVGTPMFNLYQSDNWDRRAYGAITTVPIDFNDANIVGIELARLPSKPRRALHWCYLHPRNPTEMVRELGCTTNEGLFGYIEQGRTLLMQLLALREPTT